MPNYRRARLSGATYFFTLVTYCRRPLFTDETSRHCLRKAISEVRRDHPFRIDGFCLLPDHLHTIWTLPEGDSHYSQRWKAIKGHFSRSDVLQVAAGDKSAGSRKARGETTLWQRRFWEHLIRDEDDLRRHLDYLHFNPVKHNYVESVHQWPWSSFHRFVRKGLYPVDWGGSSPARMNLKTVGE